MPPGAVSIRPALIHDARTFLAGMAVNTTQTQIERGGNQYIEIAYGWSDLKELAR
jgi:hypothetical protein